MWPFPGHLVSQHISLPLQALWSAWFHHLHILHLSHTLPIKSQIFQTESDRVDHRTQCPPFSERRLESRGIEKPAQG